MVSPAGFQCRNHPARGAIGICVICRAPVCADCTTKVDGINHCIACLARRPQRRETVRRTRPGLLVAAGIPLSIGFFWLVFLAVATLIITR